MPQSAGMPLGDIIALNPQAANGVSPGDVLTIYGSEPEIPATNYSLIDSERRISE